MLGIAKLPLYVRMWLLGGAPYGTARALVRALMLGALSVVTTVAVHVYLRALYGRHVAKQDRLTKQHML